MKLKLSLNNQRTDAKLIVLEQESFQNGSIYIHKIEVESNLILPQEVLYAQFTGPNNFSTLDLPLLIESEPQNLENGYRRFSAVIPKQVINVGTTDVERTLILSVRRIINKKIGSILVAKSINFCVQGNNYTEKEFIDKEIDELQDDLISPITKKYNDMVVKYTEIYAKNSELTNHFEIADNKLSNLESNMGDINDISPIAQNVTSAIKSLNENIDSLQLGVVPRIIRGVVLTAEPEKLDENLIDALNKKVEESTERKIPNNTDAVQAWDNKMPDAGKIFTYNYWSSDVIGSELDGWYLASIYTSPAITDIPSYVLNITNGTWSKNPDEKGLYYISIPPNVHGMGSDMSLNIDLRRTIDNKFISINFFYVTKNGTVICYSDEKFNGKLIVRVGKAYYTTNTTNIVSIEMEQVNGLQELLNEKIDSNNIKNALIKFDDIANIAPNLITGDTLDLLFGKIKNWFARLGTLAFKNKIENENLNHESIDKCKINGLIADLQSKQDLLEYDSTPTENSNNLMKSKDIKKCVDKLVKITDKNFSNDCDPYGYVKLRGGLVIQWMTNLSFGEGKKEKTIILPASFNEDRNYAVILIPQKVNLTDEGYSYLDMTLGQICTAASYTNSAVRIGRNDTSNNVRQYTLLAIGN